MSCSAMRSTQCDRPCPTGCRADRTGFPEVVWGSGKTPMQIAAIMSKLAENDEVVMATRITPDVSLHAGSRKVCVDGAPMH
jgi:NCAIR mutase (PurE)-related protein